MGEYYDINGVRKAKASYLVYTDKGSVYERDLERKERQELRRAEKEWRERMDAEYELRDLVSSSNKEYCARAVRPSNRLKGLANLWDRVVGEHRKDTWKFAALYEIFMLLILAALMTAYSPLLWIVFIPIVLLPFVPAFVMSSLVASKDAINVKPYSGSGYKVVDLLAQYLYELEKFHELVNQIDTDESVKRVYAEYEAIAWATALKTSILCRKIVKSNIALTSDAKQTMLAQYRALSRQKDDLVAIMESCRSIDVMGEADLKIDVDNSGLINMLNAKVGAQRELMTGELGDDGQ